MSQDELNAALLSVCWERHQLPTGAPPTVVITSGSARFRDGSIAAASKADLLVWMIRRVGNPSPGFVRATYSLIREASDPGSAVTFRVRDERASYRLNPDPTPDLAA